MKRQIALLLCVAMVLATLAGCVAEKEQQLPEKTQENLTQQTDTITPSKADSSAAQQTENQPPDDHKEAAGNDPVSTTVHSYDKYAINPDVLAYANVTNMELYKTLYDAIENLEDTVDISSFTISDTEKKNLELALGNRTNFEFFYFEEISIDKDKKIAKIKYGYPKKAINEMKAKFNEKVDYILNTVVKPYYSDIQKGLAIYKYIGENANYNFDSDTKIDEINGYSIMVNGKGICLGYATALKYLFDRVGIENRLVLDENPFHIWNIVKIDGEYYHLDATFEDGEGSGDGLVYFNISDEDRNSEQLFEKPWYCGNQNFKKLEPPKCADNKFKFLRDCINYDFDENWIYYTDKTDNKTYKVSYDGTQKSLK